MPGGDVQPYRPFQLGDLDFGSDLTGIARACLNNIDETTRALGLREYGVVSAWFAAVAFVSKVFYPKWSRKERGPFGRGISKVWNELPKIVPTSGAQLQQAEQEAIMLFVGPSSPPIAKGESQEHD